MSTAKKTAKKRASRPEPFAHAKDLADAYRELKSALVARLEVGPARGMPEFWVKGENITGMSMISVAEDAERRAAVWGRLAAAARRVATAIHGPLNRSGGKAWS